MIQCKDCELCQRGADGEMIFTCDPFTNIKEPECLIKWQLLKLNALIEYQEQLQQMYDRIAPMQEKLFHYMEHEMDDQEESDSWKQNSDEDEDDEERKL